MGSQADPSDGKAYVDDLTADADPPVPRHPHRARQGQPLPQPEHRGKSRPFHPHEGRRIPRRQPRSPRQDRHGLAQPQHARPGHVPHPPRHPPPHRRRVVHLSHVRLRPRPVGLDRARHPFHVHPGIRRPPAPLPLVHRKPRHLSVAADRVRPPQSHLYPALQAQAAPARAGKPRHRLGRSAHAHPLRHPPPRLHSRSPPRAVHRHRRHPDQRHRRYRNAGALPARRPQPPRHAAPWPS